MQDSPETHEPSAQPHDLLKGRLVGLALLVLGVGLSAGTFAMSKGTSGGYLFLGAWLGPFVTFLGLGALVEGPKIPVETLSPLMKVMAGVGTVGGLGLIAAIELTK